jgi:hypothetical protein
MNMKLYAENLHFLGDTPKEQASDVCIHGTPVMEINGIPLTDGEDWCVSASAFRFLQTLSENHFCGGEEQMFPCCGHYLIPSEDLQTVIIGGCPNGIDFDVIHEDGNVLFFIDDTCQAVPYEEYREAVLAYAKQIEDFFRENPPREFNDGYEKNGFTAFCNQWYAMKERPLNIDFSLEDYTVCSVEKLLSHSPHGISMQNRFVNYRECAYWFRKTNGGDGNCIGEHDDEAQEITFYTAPHPVTVCFDRENTSRRTLFRKSKPSITYHDLLNCITSYGYSTVPTP